MAKKDAAAAAATEAEGGAITEDDEGSLVVDMGGVDEDGGLELMPNGVYNCVTDECVFDYSQRSGNPMWTLRLCVTEGEYENRKLFTHLVFTDQMLPRTKKVLARINPELATSSFRPDDDRVCEAMVGLDCRARVNKRKFEGQWRNNVQDVLEPASGEGFLD